MVLMNAGLWMLLPPGLMVVTFSPGERFTHLPNAHLSESADAMKHGEILLMVDTSPQQANEVGHCVQDHHPEAVADGSSWNTPMPGTRSVNDGNAIALIIQELQQPLFSGQM